MIIFKGGPANGVVLPLQRVPILLRVVRANGSSDKWDALDQLNDEPGSDESIYLYLVDGQPQWIHVDGRDAKTGRRWGRTCYYGSYQYVTDQPADAEMRTNEAWRRWCEANKGRFIAEEVK